MKPHKHAELIKAWADGATIQGRNVYFSEGKSDWYDLNPPHWDSDRVEYRIKPEHEPEPEKRTLYIYNDNVNGTTWVSPFSPKQQGLNHLLRYEYMGKLEVTK